MDLHNFQQDFGSKVKELNMFCTDLISYTCWKYVNCVISMPSIQTSQPNPQAPRTCQ
jgi:hypothetical protein